MISIPEFDWDDANTAHIARHNISPDEVEDAILEPKMRFTEVQSHAEEERYGLVGATRKWRILFVVVTVADDLIRPIRLSMHTGN